MSNEEERFIEYWEQNREKEKKLFRQLVIGLPLGSLIGIGIIVSLLSGWYERANMEANTESNPFVLIIAVVAIAVFFAIFYKKYTWDMNEQHYKELLFKKEKENKSKAAEQQAQSS